MTDTHHLLELLQMGQLSRAKADARTLTEMNPRDAFGWKVLGTLLVRDGETETALPILEEARRLAPNDAEILNSLGQAYRARTQLHEALGIFRKALELQPDLFELWHNRAMTEQELGLLDEALTSYDRAIRLAPAYAKAHHNRGYLLSDMDRPEEALEAYDRALALTPASAEILNNRALALQDLGRLEEALLSLDEALVLQPDFATAHNNRGNVLKGQGRLDEALASYERALSIQPNLIVAGQNRLLCLNYQAELSPERLYAEHRAFGEQLESMIERLPPDTSRDRDPLRRLRVGFVSGDFRQHSVAFFLMPVLAHLDRQRFEIVCYSTCTIQDDWTREFRRLADVWVDASVMEHDGLAKRIRADTIDLLVDLSGHMKESALPAFAAKPAPVQLTWLGYPNTTGLSTMDYRMVDAVTDPVGVADGTHSECLIRLPMGFLCYRPWGLDGEPPQVGPLPCLSAGSVTFGSFNNLAKVTPPTLELWRGILEAVPRSRLRLKSNLVADAPVWQAVVGYLVDRGIDRERLEALPRACSLSEHLALYQGIDIALDTSPYHGTTTTCETLHFGVDRNQDGTEGYHKIPRDARGSQDGGDRIPIPFRSGAAGRVIAIQQLAAAIDPAIQPSRFALEMIEGVEKVRFLR